MLTGQSAAFRLSILLILVSAAALALSLGGAALLDRDARRLRAGEAARFDMAALAEKLKGALDDPDAGPLLTASTEQIARYSGEASGRTVLFVANRANKAARPWPQQMTPLSDGLVLVPQSGAEAVGVVRVLPAGRLLITRDVQPTGPLGAILIRYAIVTAALLVGLAGLAAWLAGRMFTARIAELNAVCNAVETGDVAARVPAQAGSDELAVLSRHLNRMLAELERRIGNLRASSDRIAHDLRTPLARLGSRLSLLGDPARGDQAAQIDSAKREIGDLLAAFNGLLDLREIETESGMLHVPFALTAVVEDAIELYEAVAEEQSGFTIERRLEPVTVQGVPPLMTRAVANLIDNALRASPPGGVVTVLCRRDGDQAIVEVRDHGAGPPGSVITALADDLGQVSGWGGHGIGLSIVSAVARRHCWHFSLARDGTETIASLTGPATPRDAGD